jgi:hypothetical protein
MTYRAEADHQASCGNVSAECPLAQATYDALEASGQRVRMPILPRT